MLNSWKVWGARNASFSTVSMAAFVAALTCTAYIAALIAMDGDWVAALRDRVLASDKSIVSGSVSNIGILMMALASAALAVACKAHNWKHEGLSGLLGFSFLFVLDDAFMFHEALGRFEVVFFAVYAFLFAASWLIFMRTSHIIPIWPLFLAGGAFALSLVIDVTSDKLVPVLDAVSLPRSVTYFLEDLPKFVGIVLFTGFSFSEAAQVRQQNQGHASQPE